MSDLIVSFFLIAVVSAAIVWGCWFAAFILVLRTVGIVGLTSRSLDPIEKLLLGVLMMIVVAAIVCNPIVVWFKSANVEFTEEFLPVRIVVFVIFSIVHLAILVLGLLFANRLLDKGKTK